MSWLQSSMVRLATNATCHRDSSWQPAVCPLCSLVCLELSCFPWTSRCVPFRAEVVSLLSVCSVPAVILTPSPPPSTPALPLALPLPVALLDMLTEVVWIVLTLWPGLHEAAFRRGLSCGGQRFTIIIITEFVCSGWPCCWPCC
jgi:hypothetical protein